MRVIHVEVSINRDDGYIPGHRASFYAPSQAEVSVRLLCSPEEADWLMARMHQEVDFGGPKAKPAPELGSGTQGLERGPETKALPGLVVHEGELVEDEEP